MSTRTLYLGQVSHDGSCIHEELYPDPAARTAGLTAVLEANHDEVTPQELAEVMAAHEGEHPDEVLTAVHALFNERCSDGVDISHGDLVVAETLPERLWVATTVRPRGDRQVEVHPSEASLATELSERLEAMGFPAGVERGLGALVVDMEQVVASQDGTFAVDVVELADGAWALQEEA